MCGLESNVIGHVDDTLPTPENPVNPALLRRSFWFSFSLLIGISTFPSHL